MRFQILFFSQFTSI